MNDLKNIFEEIETSRGKVGEILGLSALLNKIVCPTYLSSDKDYLIVSDAEIEGVHGLPLDNNYILGDFSMS